MTNASAWGGMASPGPVPGGMASREAGRHEHTRVPMYIGAWAWHPALLLLLSGCGAGSPPVVDRPIETSFAFTNFSTRFYAALRIREHATNDPPAEYFATSLLPPGATQRVRFLDSIDGTCPQSLDFQIFLYRRVNEDAPIGLDPSEAVDPSPHVAGEVLDVPACSVQALETYTIVNFDAPEGQARVKFAQATPVEQAIIERGLFPNADAAWETEGVDPAIGNLPPPPPAERVSIAGRVTLADGTGLEGVGVVIRTRFRIRLNDGDLANDPDAGYGEPIDVVATDAEGAFEFLRPGGAYQVEFFADDLLFRPPALELETPSEVIDVIAELLLGSGAFRR